MVAPHLKTNNKILRVRKVENMDSKFLKYIEHSQKTFLVWRNVPFEEKQQMFSVLSKLLLEKRETFAKIITKEMHKPLAQSLAEIDKSAGMCRYYAEAPNVLSVENIPTEHEISQVYHEPLGIILGIMPWNFPFWQVLRFAVPTILAGNTVFLKHASICKESGDAIADLFLKAGFPEGVFTHLEMNHQEVEALLSNPFIKAVSLTGSEIAGRRIAEIAGRNLKKCVLELGGSDAFIVCEDADVKIAAKDAAQARLQNTGQSCVAGKRFIIHEKVYEDFMDYFVKEYEKYKPQDPFSMDTSLGAMAREDLALDLEAQYEKALEHGAQVVVPLKRITNQAFSPGIIKMNEGNPIRFEELFGPLAMVFKVSSDEEALRVANETPFGLGNAVFTKSKERAQYFIHQLESGSVAINQVFRSDARLPFNGRKNSGYGVELSLYALQEFTVKKTVIGNY